MNSFRQESQEREQRQNKNSPSTYNKKNFDSRNYRLDDCAVMNRQNFGQVRGASSLTMHEETFRFRWVFFFFFFFFSRFLVCQIAFQELLYPSFVLLTSSRVRFGGIAVCLGFFSLFSLFWFEFSVLETDICWHRPSR
jgi:hypothetical protein